MLLVGCLFAKTSRLVWLLIIQRRVKVSFFSENSSFFVCCCSGTWYQVHRRRSIVNRRCPPWSASFVVVVIALMMIMPMPLRPFGGKECFPQGVFRGTNFSWIARTHCHAQHKAAGRCSSFVVVDGVRCCHWRQRRRRRCCGGSCGPCHVCLFSILFLNSSIARSVGTTRQRQEMRLGSIALRNSLVGIKQGKKSKREANALFPVRKYCISLSVHTAEQWRKNNMELR